MAGLSFWRVTFSRVISTYAVVIFTILWAGFAIALITDAEWPSILLDRVQALPTLVEILIWVLFLPIMMVLWIWEASWSTCVTVLAFIGIVVWTILAISSFMKAIRQD